MEKGLDSIQVHTHIHLMHLNTYSHGTHMDTHTDTHTCTYMYRYTYSVYTAQKCTLTFQSMYRYMCILTFQTCNSRFKDSKNKENYEEEVDASECCNSIVTMLSLHHFFSLYAALTFRQVLFSI